MYVVFVLLKSTLLDFNFSTAHSIALQALYMLRAAYPSVRHTAILYQNEGMQRVAVFTIG